MLKWAFEAKLSESGFTRLKDEQDLVRKAVTQTLIPFCSIEEQHNTVKIIKSRLSVADKIEESRTQSLQQTEALRQSILKKAFEGRLI